MANELQIDYLTGKTVYFLIRNATAQIWKTSAFEAYSTAHYASYPVSATEQGTASAYYTASMPAAITAGFYYVTAKVQAGGSPAESDISVGNGSFEWDGSVVATGITSMLTTAADWEAHAPATSLGSVVLKLTSKFDSSTGTTYRTNGTTTHMVQTPTTDATLVPIKSLGVAS